jgi:hypothetical protein
MRGKPDEIDQIAVIGYPDADLANDPATMKSTSGHVCAVQGPVTFIPQEWGAKGQNVTARHTAEAELSSLDRMTFVSAIPMALLWGRILGRPLRVVAREDNDACVASVRKGISRKMSYVPRTQKISISALNEFYYGDPDVISDDRRSDNYLVRIASEDQLGDVYTKGLPAEQHWDLLFRAGLMPVPALLDGSKL